MPFRAYIGEELPGDVGVEDYHEESDSDVERSMIKVRPSPIRDR